MRKLFLLPAICLATLSLFSTSTVNAQMPCSAPEFRQFDFWIGEWEAFNPKGQKAGDSKISRILDSCVILEEWTSATVQRGLRYSGKSFNSYDPRRKNWKQYWLDNTGGWTFYNKGWFDQNKIIFETENIQVNDTLQVKQRLTFYDLGKDKVRQHGESSNDNGNTWKTSYDLEYRRKQ